MKNKEQQPDYLNPDSPKYYKGFSYVVNEYGEELWYDENDVLRKEINYYDNGNKRYETYWNNNGDVHNEDGLAYIEWNYEGKIIVQEYHLNGKILTKKQWEREVAKLKIQLDTSLPTEEEVLKTIFDCVFIRGLELEDYKHNFSNEQSGLYDALVKLFRGDKK